MNDFFKNQQTHTAFCPYRVCPLGAHIDHQHGIVTGFALDKGITITYSISDDGMCRVKSANMEGEKEFKVSHIPHKVGDWADHMRGVIQILKRDYDITKGVTAYIEGSLPIGGLSSSAAVIIAFMSAICKANGIEMTKPDVIKYAMAVENKYVGVNCGKLDQSTEVYSQAEHLLYLDTEDDSYKLISPQNNMPDYEIGIFFSGVPRSLAGTAYNMRVDECKAAAYALMAFEGMEYHKFNDTYLRDVPYEVFIRHKDKLPENWRKRAEHFYNEQSRVKMGAKLWEQGDLQGFGRLINESGKSSIESYETGSPELKALYEALLECEGVYGTRFSGAGFKGCCMALVNPRYKDNIKKYVTKKYLRIFPQLRDNYEVHYCKTADGVDF